MRADVPTLLFLLAPPPPRPYLLPPPPRHCLCFPDQRREAGAAVSAELVPVTELHSPVGGQESHADDSGPPSLCGLCWH